MSIERRDGISNCDMSNDSAPKVKLTLMLMLVTLVGLGIFFAIIYTAERTHHETMLGEAALAHLRVLVTSPDGNIIQTLTVPANSYEKEDYRYTSVRRGPERDGWVRTAGIALPKELQSILVTSGDTEIALEGVVRVEQYDYGWALIPVPGGQQGHFVYRSHLSFSQFFWADLGTPIVVATVIVLWLVLWGALSVGGLVNRSREQNRMLRQSTEELATARDEALIATQAKSEFLSRMSHELRTPMNAVLGFTQLLKLDSSLDEEQQKYVSHINLAGNHLLSLIDEVLDLERVEAGKIDLILERVDLVEVIQECERLTRSLVQEHQVLFRTLVTSSSPGTVWADKIRLKQVLLNLITNAIKYNREGGEVEVSCAESENNQIFIKVRDTGRGIRDQDLEELFEPFSRLGAEKYGIEGTGIGLTITRKLVLLMGGKIGVESTFGTGSTFSIILPTRSN